MFYDAAPAVTTFATWAEVVRAAEEARAGGRGPLRVSVGNGASAPAPAEPPPREPPEACRARCESMRGAGELKEGISVEDCVRALCGE